jgi:hypothetical protein
MSAAADDSALRERNRAVVEAFFTSNLAGAERTARAKGRLPIGS